MVSGDLVKINIPIPDRRKDSLLNLELKVQINGSLESAGRRISFLARLLEKYNIYNLNR
jgi:hypothetical protein